MRRTIKQRGEGRTRLSLRGKHRGERLKARRKTWMNSKRSQDFPSAYHEPGSGKK